MGDAAITTGMLTFLAELYSDAEPSERKQSSELLAGFMELGYRLFGHLRQHLLEPVEVLEARQQRIHAQCDARDADVKARRRARRDSRPIMPADDTRRPLIAGRGIPAPCCGAARHDHDRPHARRRDCRDDEA